jgi:asparagine N-glycosylation enzyme membrane subunit Stt3
VLVFVILLLRPYELGFSVKAGATYRALWEQGILEQPMVDTALAEAFEERRNGNAVVVRRLVSFLALTLVAVVLETAGLATAAALAS